MHNCLRGIISRFGCEILFVYGGKAPDMDKYAFMFQSKGML